jgi:hypothetical protein
VADATQSDARRRGSRAPALLGLVLANLLRVAATAALVYAGCKLFLTLSMAWRGASWEFIFAVMLRDGVYAIAAAFLLTVIAARGTFSNLAQRLGAARLDRVLAWLVVFTSAAATFAAIHWAVEYQGPRPANRFGFVTSYYPGATTEVPARPNIPGFTVRTNSDGYRDSDFGPAEPGVRRAIVVGDSMVAGSGIDGEDGLLDRSLERHLKLRTGDPWEVWNLSATPGALWYYAETVRSVAPDVKPELAIISHVKLFDLEAFEIQRLYRGSHPLMVAAYHWFGLDRQIMLEGLRSVEAMESKPEARAAARERARRILGAVIEDMQRAGVRLVLWLPHGPEPAFAPFENDPRVTFLDWRAVAALERKEVEDLRFHVDPNDGWWREAPLCFIGDGHPRPLANDLIAQAIAAVMK